MQNAISLGNTAFACAKHEIEAIEAGVLTVAQQDAIALLRKAAEHYFLLRAGEKYYVCAGDANRVFAYEELDAVCSRECIVSSVEDKTVEYRALVDAFFDLPEGVEEKELEGPKPGFYPPKDLPRIELLRMLTGDADCGPYVAYRPDEEEPSREELVARLLSE